MLPGALIRARYGASTGPSSRGPRDGSCTVPDSHPLNLTLEGRQMTRVERLQRLRERIAEIELLPASPERDRLLSEFRSRTVDIDTGVEPRAVLPIGEPVPAPERPRRQARHHVAPTATGDATSTPAPAPPHERGRPALGRTRPVAEVFGVGEWLSLDDALAADVRTRGGRPAKPWTRGLRG